MCLAVQLPTPDAARLAAQLGRTLFGGIAELDYPPPPRWTSVFALPYLPIVRDGDAVLARWPFLPPQVRDLAEARFWCDRTGNCRADEMDTKPTWKEAAQKRRCLIPVVAYFEHQHRAKPGASTPLKVPYRLHREADALFWIGGLWQLWQGEPTATLCTMPANALNAWVHNSKPRQPVVVPDEWADTWLRGKLEDLAPLLLPRDDDGIVAEETENINGRRVTDPAPKAKPPKKPDPGAGQGELF